MCKYIFWKSNNPLLHWIMDGLILVLLVIMNIFSPFDKLNWMFFVNHFLFCLFSGASPTQLTADNLGICIYTLIIALTCWVDYLELDTALHVINRRKMEVKTMPHFLSSNTHCILHLCMEIPIKIWSTSVFILYNYFITFSSQLADYFYCRSSLCYFLSESES